MGLFGPRLSQAEIMEFQERQEQAAEERYQKQQAKVRQLEEQVKQLLSSKPTRVEVILKSGRAYSKWLTNTHFTISIQDDGRTIKLFEEQT